MALKPRRRIDCKEVVYNNARWKLLKELREKAIEIMAALENFHLSTLVYGSIARGDVSKNSDIDVFISEPPSSFLVEIALEKNNLPVNARFLIQATPNYAMKAYIEINAKTNVSFPLMRMRKVEREFYRFGGEVTFSQLKKDLRVQGIDKRLLFIEPTKRGHIESSVTGREESVAKHLGISAETVLDRVHTLLKRDQVGRKGVFIKKQLSADETFEMTMKKLADSNPAVRRRMK